MGKRYFKGWEQVRVFAGEMGKSYFQEEIGNKYFPGEWERGICQGGKGKGSSSVWEASLTG